MRSTEMTDTTRPTREVTLRPRANHRREKQAQIIPARARQPQNTSVSCLPIAAVVIDAEAEKLPQGTAVVELATVAQAADRPWVDPNLAAVTDGLVKKSQRAERFPGWPANSCTNGGIQAKIRTTSPRMPNMAGVSPRSRWSTSRW